MTDLLQRQHELPIERLGLKLTAHLSDAADALPHDMSERLRVARHQAVARRKVAQRQTAPHLVLASANLDGGTHDESLGWLGRLGVYIPLFALVVGIYVIHDFQNEHLLQETVEIDMALLTDELPPNAYSDPGFSRFIQLVNHHRTGN